MDQNLTAVTRRPTPKKQGFSPPAGRRTVPSASGESHCVTTCFMQPKLLRRNTIRAVDAMTVTDSARIGRNRPHPAHGYLGLVASSRRRKPAADRRGLALVVNT